MFIHIKQASPEVQSQVCQSCGSQSTDNCIAWFDTVPCVPEVRRYHNRRSKLNSSYEQLGYDYIDRQASSGIADSNFFKSISLSVRWGHNRVYINWTYIRKNFRYILLNSSKVMITDICIQISSVSSNSSLSKSWHHEGVKFYTRINLLKILFSRAAGQGLVISICKNHG